MPRQTFDEAVLPHFDAAFNFVRWLTNSDADAGTRSRTAPGDPRAVGDANGRAIVICLEAGTLLDTFVDHELGPAESADLQAHLAPCTACRQLLADRESLGRLVRQ